MYAPIILICSFSYVLVVLVNCDVQAERLLSEEQIEKLKEGFSIIDRNGDGSIVINELRKVMKALGEHRTEAQLNKMIKDIDVNGNGKVDFYEFLKLTTPKIKALEKGLKEAFGVIDRDGSGFISTAELKRVMKNLNYRLTDEEINKMIKNADVTGDGKINYEEFAKELIKHIHKI